MSVRILITGAADGIGAAAVGELRRRGARVIGLDLRGDGGDVLEADVRDQESVNAAVAAATERLGGLDVLINNAGVGDAHDTGAAPDESVEAVIAVNLLGPWRVTAAALPALLESQGRVVNVASGLAHLTVPLAAAYCASKRGLVAFSDALRVEYRDRLTVTTVYPGYVRTSIHDGPGAKGIALEGAVPAESLEDVTRTLARAALDRPRRDLATTRRGSVSYALARLAPRAVLDQVVELGVRRQAKTGRLADSDLARALADRLGGH